MWRTFALELGGRGESIRTHFDVFCNGFEADCVTPYTMETVREEKSCEVSWTFSK